MEREKATVGLYGIPDRNNLPFPEESHDHGIVLMNKGKVIKLLQLERKTRLKHDHNLPRHLFDLLKSEGLLKGDYDIAFSNNILGSSMITDNGKIRVEGAYQDVLSTRAVKAHSFWFDHRRDAWLVNHELAHLYSALPFFGQFPKNSLLIHFDGGASLSNFSAWSNKGGKLSLLEAHWDLKYLSAFFNANALCFGIIGAKKEEQLAVPGKMMGLASFGEYSVDIEDWLKGNNWFANIWGSKKIFFDSAKKHFGWQKKSLDNRDNFLQDIIATFQEIFLRDTLEKITSLAVDNELESLVFTGGSALNIVLNARLVRSGIFKEVLIPPCTNDSGLALGAASLLEFNKHGSIELHSPFLDDWGESDLSGKNNQYTIRDLELIAKKICDGEIIGVCNGKGEIGPRALGNRSLICRADNPELAKKLSMEIKGREWYRPLAPIMRKENLEKYTGEKSPSSLGKFMLDEFKILDKHRKAISGAVHVDGTARIQFLENKEDNPFVWDLLVHLEENFNIDCLINTSFNIRGEPIVGSADDAKNTARRMGIKGLVINGRAEQID